ncbi:MAG: 4-hydroxy-tetrahydrodipicolinate synthase [Lachnospiraceae bacterium]
MKQAIFSGAATALVTPMKEDGSIHYSSLEALLEYQISNKIDALVVAGTTGEASVLSADEYQSLLQFVVKQVNHRVPVIAGAGSNNTAHAVFLSQIAESCEVDALLQVTPYYNKASQAGLIAHFTACADSVSLPIILYNVPSRTSVNLLPDTVLSLSQHPNIYAIKEASSNINQICRLASLCNHQIHIYSGNDDQIVPVMSLGGIGVISVLSNILPRQVHELCLAMTNSDLEHARNLQLALMPIIDALFCDINPIPVKEMMNQLGFSVGSCRLPLTDLNVLQRDRFNQAIPLVKQWMTESSHDDSCCSLSSYKPLYK